MRGCFLAITSATALGLASSCTPRPQTPPVATVVPTSSPASTADASLVPPDAATHTWLLNPGPFRLPHTFEPVGYRLRIALENERQRFDGSIEIDADITEPLSLVWLDAVDLNVSEARAQRAGQPAQTLGVGVANGRIGLRSDLPLEPGRWTIAIAYTGIVRDREAQIASRWSAEPVDPPAFGLFRRALGGNVFWFTNTEPIEARRIFPCIDEPDRKVPWRITLDVPEGSIAVANAVATRDYALDVRHHRFEFAPTPPLPSYLVAFAAGPFSIQDGGTTKHGAHVRMLTARGDTIVAKRVAATAVRILDLLDAWFDVPYAYTKLDLVAVPRLHLAMENPGLVTVEETWLEHGDAWVGTLSHELAHQWFGDLVTPKWWDDLWLNESFAAWMAAKVSLDPDRIIAHDAADTRLPWQPRKLRVDVTDRGKLVVGRFYYLVDDTPVQVLDAMERYVGAERFRRAVHEYMVSHAHGTVTSEDLFAAIGTVAGRDVASTLEGMINGNRPVVEMKLGCVGRRASIDAHLEPGSRPVSVCYAYDRDGKRADGCATVVRDARVSLAATKCPTWFVPDVGGTAFGHVHRRDISERALPSLTNVEQRVLLQHVGNDHSIRIALQRTMLEHGDTKSMAAAAKRLLYERTLAPADVRDALDAWLLRVVAPRAGRARFGSTVEQLPLDTLLAIAGEPDRRREAFMLVASRSHLETEVGAAAVQVAVMDPERRKLLIHDAITAAKPVQAAIVTALTNLPDPIDLLRDHFEELSSLHDWDYRLVQFLRMSCDPARRDEQIELTRKRFHDRGDASKDVDDCIKRHTEVEAPFRAWVGTTRR